LLAALALVLIEEAGVPIPVPGDFMMLVLGVRARRGLVPLWQALVLLEVATVAGATILYALSRWAGRALVYRYGRFIRLTPERLARAERWLQRHGFAAVVLGRLLPGLRIVTTVACGVLSVPLRTFLPAMACGALLYVAAYTLLGYYFGPPVVDVLERAQLPLGVAGAMLVLALLVAWLVRARRALRLQLQELQQLQEAAGGGGAAAGTRGTSAWVPERRRWRAGAIAGGVATLASTLLMNVLVHVAGNLALLAPGTIVAHTARRLAVTLAERGEPLLFVLAAPLFLAVGVGWGAVYAAWFAPRVRLPDWAKGLAFALLPLATALLLVLPLLGLGFLAVDAGVVAAAGEAIRHAAYGVVLGLGYPVFLLRRRRRRRSAAQSGSDSAGLSAAAARTEAIGYTGGAAR
jgi:membrane protein DedA with SNARE-associated domain